MLRDGGGAFTLPPRAGGPADGGGDYAARRSLFPTACDRDSPPVRHRWHNALVLRPSLLRQPRLSRYNGLANAKPTSHDFGSAEGCNAPIEAPLITLPRERERDQVSLLHEGHGYTGAERPRGARSRRGAAAYGMACSAWK